MIKILKKISVIDILLYQIFVIFLACLHLSCSNNATKSAQQASPSPSPYGGFNSGFASPSPYSSASPNYSSSPYPGTSIDPLASSPSNIDEFLSPPKLALCQSSGKLYDRQASECMEGPVFVGKAGDANCTVAWLTQQFGNSQAVVTEVNNLQNLGFSLDQCGRASANVSGQLCGLKGAGAIAMFLKRNPDGLSLEFKCLGSRAN